MHAVVAAGLEFFVFEVEGEAGAVGFFGEEAVAVAVGELIFLFVSNRRGRKRGVRTESLGSRRFVIY